MEVVTISATAWQTLLNKFDELSKKINQDNNDYPLSDIWMDNQDVCQLLKISKRTLQHYRDTGKISFSQIGAKIYYKASDVNDFLEYHYKDKKQ